MSIRVFHKLLLTLWATAFIPIASGQVYMVEIMSSERHFDLEFVSLDETTLHMLDEDLELVIPIASITQIQKFSGSLIDSASVQDAGFNLLRGLAGGILSGGVGAFVGGSVGWYLGALDTKAPEGALAYAIGGGVAGTGVFTLIGFNYFSRQKLRDGSNYHYLANLPVEEKYKRIRALISNQQP